MIVDYETAKAWLAWSFSPTLGAVFVTFLISILSPLFFHYYLYRSRASLVIPSFLLLGPSGAGKTTLMTSLESGKASSTHTSQEAQTVQCSLPLRIIPASSKYRAHDDPSKEQERKLEVIDTPGHGKLRHYAFNAVTDCKTLRGVVFVVDAAALSSAAGLTEAASYLHDLLLELQRRHTTAKTSKGPAAIPVLIAANKLDLFTALPPQLVKQKLQDEISKIRSTRSRGLLDGDEEEREWLGEGGEGAFTFEQMREAEVDVSVVGGNVTGDEARVDEWWKWLAEQM